VRERPLRRDRRETRCGGCGGGLRSGAGTAAAGALLLFAFVVLLFLVLVSQVFSTSAG
jgi:hypothetical protein